MRRSIFLASICLLLPLGACDCEEDEGGTPVDAGDVVDVMDADDAADAQGDADDTEDVADARDDVEDAQGDATDAEDDAADAQGDATDTQGDADGGTTGVADLLVRIGQQPVSDVDVIVHAPDGSVTDQLTTDSNGEAQLQISPGSMVTVVESADLPPQFPAYYTVADLEIDDSIVIGIQPDSERVGEVLVSLPGNYQSTTGAYVDLGCRGQPFLDASVADDIFINDRCPQGGDIFDLVATATGSNGERQAYVVENDITRNQSGVTQVSYSNWQTSFNVADITYEDIPTPRSSARIDFALDANGVRFDGPSSAFATSSGGANAETSSFQYVPGYADAILADVQYEYDVTGQQRGLNSLVQRDAGASSDKSLTASGNDMLPKFDSMALQNQASARPTMVWTTSPVVTGGATRSDADAGGIEIEWDQGGRQDWQVVIPSSPGQFQFPELPAGLPDPSGGGISGTAVRFFEVPSLSNYDDVKSAPLDPTQGSAAETFEVGLDGGRETRVVVGD